MTEEGAALSAGEVLHANGRFREAIDCVDRVLSRDPRCGRGWFLRGVCLTALRRYEEAIRCFDNALAIAPRSVECLAAKAAALSAVGRLEAALQCYERAVAMGAPASVLEQRNATLARLGFSDDDG
jgi:tetratricopeptide (TPR) repeat protein